MRIYQSTQLEPVCIEYSSQYPVVKISSVSKMTWSRNNRLFFNSVQTELQRELGYTFQERNLLKYLMTFRMRLEMDVIFVNCVKRDPENIHTLITECSGSLAKVRLY